jgi:hypothetical protein
MRAQFGRRYLGERSSKFAHPGSGGSDNNDFIHYFSPVTESTLSKSKTDIQAIRHDEKSTREKR